MWTFRTANGNQPIPRVLTDWAGDPYTAVDNGSGDGGLRTAARFSYGVQFVAVDPSNGDVYLSDAVAFTVRKIDVSTGIVSHVMGVAGTQASTGDGGLATAAGLTLPRGIAIAPDGTIYIADQTSIRKIDPATGIVSRYAGTGAGGNVADGSAALVTPISNCNGLALDPDGNLYYAEETYQRVRKIAVGTTIVSTVVTTADLTWPWQITWDSYDSALLVAGYGGNNYLKAKGGVITTIAGQFGVDTATPASLAEGMLATDCLISMPMGITCDADYYYILDAEWSRVCAVSKTTGILTVYAGLADGWVASGNDLYQYHGWYAKRSDVRMYNNSCIVKYGNYMYMGTVYGRSSIIRLEDVA